MITALRRQRRGVRRPIQVSDIEIVFGVVVLARSVRREVVTRLGERNPQVLGSHAVTGRTRIEDRTVQRGFARVVVTLRVAPEVVVRLTSPVVAVLAVGNNDELGRMCRHVIDHPFVHRLAVFFRNSVAVEHVGSRDGLLVRTQVIGRRTRSTGIGGDENFGTGRDG